ncbi:MAG: hypothetical protein ACR5LA_07865 [Wolbachia sp.]
MKIKGSVQQSGKIGRQDKPKNQEKVSLQVYNKWSVLDTRIQKSLLVN